MKFEKLSLLTLLFTFCAAFSARADRFTGLDESNPKDSVVVKLDSTIFKPNGFWSFSDLIPNETDEVIADRLSCLQSEIPLTFNPYVRNFVDYFTIRNRKYTRRMLERENLYFPLFEKYLKEHNMPTELKYLAVVESALNPKAKSGVGAMGLWQFMPATGNDFKLIQNSFYDERMDPEQSTIAACKFLRSLYKMFGDWELALAAYNCGPGNVRKAIKRAGGGTQTFWAIFPYLPKETRGYVPSFTAVMYAMNYADHHKISSDSLQFAIATDTVLLNQGIDLDKFSAELRMDPEELKKLNPALKKNYIPETVRNFAIKVPAEKRVVIAQNRSNIFTNSKFISPVYKAPEPVMVAKVEKTEPVKTETPKTETDSTSQQQIAYKVKRGDYLAKIAREHNVTMADLKTWNKLKTTNVQVNQELVILQPAAPQDSAQTTLLASSETKSAVENPEVKANQTPVVKTAMVKHTAPVKHLKEKMIIHSVQPGDTLWNISKKYNGISVEEIKKKNKLKSDELKPGQKLVIS